jgi:hypothetical protein
MTKCNIFRTTAQKIQNNKSVDFNKRKGIIKMLAEKFMLKKEELEAVSGGGRVYHCFVAPFRDYNLSEGKYVTEQRVVMRELLGFNEDGSCRWGKTTSFPVWQWKAMKGGFLLHDHDAQFVTAKDGEIVPFEL